MKTSSRTSPSRGFTAATSEAAQDPVFLSEWSPPARSALLQIGRVFRYHGETILQREGLSSDRMSWIRSGRAKMCRMTAAGKRLILSLLGPGDLFGVEGAIGGSLCSTTVVAHGELEVLTIYRSDLFGLLAARPELAADILPRVTGHVRECRNCLVEASCSTVEVRFAQLFRDLAERFGQGDQGSVRIPVVLSRQELADLAGTRIETTIRLLSRWARDGVLTTEQDGFVIHDPTLLDDIASC